jgi:prepilin-type N-terminal cleavage/methylation domain-containing protein
MHREMSRSNHGKGFTLIEVMVAIMLIGTGIVALLGASMAGTRSTDAGKKMSQAVFLAQEIREWTLRLPFSDQDEADVDKPPGPDGTSPQQFVDDLDDLMDVTYSPPRDGQFGAIADMTAWSETITLTWRDPTSLDTVVADGASDVIHVHLSVAHAGKQVLETSWIVVRRN